MGARLKNTGETRIATSVMWDLRGHRDPVPTVSRGGIVLVVWNISSLLPYLTGFGDTQNKEPQRVGAPESGSFRKGLA